jgi:tRNA G18 (ribose-2'-O)-methylase SpoU
MSSVAIDKLGNEIIFLENIRSLHNVGSIFRTTDGAGFSGIILGGYTGCPPDRRIEKVSLGAENSLPWRKAEEIIFELENLKNNGFLICALEQTEKSIDIFDDKKLSKIDLSKIVLILGNEVEGVSDEVLSLADCHFHMTMSGSKSSLNVAVASGIAMYRLKNIVKY